MPVPGLDPEKCKRRNRLAARDGFNALPVRFLSATETQEDTYRVVQAKGSLPRSDSEALRRINALRLGDRILTLNDIHIHYAEAGNSNYVAKYSMHLGDSTLRNIATKAEDGIAFMNSHRTGGMSEPTELPYGRTFAGRYEKLKDESGNMHSRLILGFYMNRGDRPNGDNGPSTDELSRGINNGTIFDVSLGLGRAGEKICDVCGEDMDEWDEEDDDSLCPHIPGTTYKMSEEQIAAQEERGIPGGVCSFTLENGTAGEFSAVFDGALPGAGFRRALSLARHGSLDDRTLAEARIAFAGVMKDSDFAPRSGPNRAGGMGGNEMPKPKPDLTNMNLQDMYEFWVALGRPESINIPELAAAVGGGNAKPAESAPAPTPTLAPTPKPTPAPQTAQQPQQGQGSGDLDAMRHQVELLSEQLNAERQERQAERERERERVVEVQAKQFADEQVSARRATPAERATLHSLYARAALDDAVAPVKVPYQDPTDGATKLGTRVDALKASYARRQPHQFTEDLTAQNPRDRAKAALSTLGNDVDPPPSVGDLCEAGARAWAEKRNGRRPNPSANGTH
jgi:DNA-binding protein H-NS